MNNAFHPRLNLPPSETVSQFENSEDGGKLQTYYGRKQRCHPYIRFVRHSKWDSFMFISLRRLIATQSLEGTMCTYRSLLVSIQAFNGGFGHLILPIRTYSGT